MKKTLLSTLLALSLVLSFQVGNVTSVLANEFAGEAAESQTSDQATESADVSDSTLVVSDDPALVEAIINEDPASDAAVEAATDGAENIELSEENVAEPITEATVIEAQAASVAPEADEDFSIASGEDSVALTSEEAAEPAEEEVAEEPAVSLKEIYVNPARGNDENTGEEGSPVKTLEQAVALLYENPDADTIYVESAMAVAGELSLPDGVVLKRAPGYSGTIITVSANESLVLSNIVIDGDETATNSKSAIVVYGYLQINEGSVIQNNKCDGWYSYGAVKVESSGTVEMNGGTIRNNQAMLGGGVTVVGTFILNDGVINGNKALCTGYSNRAAGGGVCLWQRGVMYMNGGVVSNNASTYFGGGVCLGANSTDSVNVDGPKFYMTDGLFVGNTSGNCGGALFVQCRSVAEISGGVFTENRSKGGLFGGGAIYVNGGLQNWAGDSFVNGELYLTNAVITDNRAGSRYGGGGLASCPTSHTAVNINNGSYIADNFAGSQANDIRIDNSVYPVYGPTVAESYISSHTLGGGNYNWKYAGSDNDFTWGDRTRSIGRWTYFSLYAQPDEDAYDVADSLASVYIYNNSAASYGGGVGSNGDVTIGTQDTFSGSLQVSKSVVAEQADPDAEFTFTVTLDQYVADGIYGDMEFVDSVATFTLKDGESKYATGLPDGAKYTVTEEDTPGFVVYSEGETGQFLNPGSTYEAAFINVQETTRIEGVKVWEGDKEEWRPESITVRLYANGEEVASQEVTAESDWAYSFSNVPYAIDGAIIEYTLSEDAVAGYTASIDGFDVVNRATTREVIISKVAAGGGEELAGAQLSIAGETANGLEIEPITWESDGTEHKVTLPAGTYTLTEDQAPLGYAVAESITFVVSDEGFVTIDGQDTDGKVVMEDALLPGEDEPDEPTLEPEDEPDEPTPEPEDEPTPEPEDEPTPEEPSVGPAPTQEEDPIPEPELVLEDEPVVEPEPEPEPEPEVEVGPEPTQEEDPTPVSEPEEPSVGPAPTQEEDPIPEPELVLEDEPVVEPEPVVENEPVVDDEPMVEPEPEPVVEDEPQPTIEEETVEVVESESVETPAQEEETIEMLPTLPSVDEGAEGEENPVAEPSEEPAPEESVEKPAPVEEKKTEAKQPTQPAPSKTPAATPTVAPTTTPVAPAPNAPTQVTGMAKTFDAIGPAVVGLLALVALAAGIVLVVARRKSDN